MGSSKTVHCWGFGGELGGWGCSGESGCVFHHFRVSACGPEWGRAGVSAVDGGDVAVVLGGSRFGTGDRGPDWGELGRLGGVVARHLGLWGRGGRSIE